MIRRSLNFKCTELTKVEHVTSKLREDEWGPSSALEGPHSMSKFKCALCTEMFSSESYLMQKENEIYQLKYDMFMTFERDKGKDYTCAISS